MKIDKNFPGYSRFPVRIKGLNCLKNAHKALNELQGFNTYYSLFNNYTINIIQIGAGGTGGYVFAEMMRYISNLPQHIQHRIHYTLCDGDTFESKNVKRQLCTEDDIGCNKASNLVERCIEAYNMNSMRIQAYPHYIKNIRQLQELSFGIPIVCCVSSGLRKDNKTWDADFRDINSIKNEDDHKNCLIKFNCYRKLFEEFSYSKNKKFTNENLAIKDGNPLALRGYSLSECISHEAIDENYSEDLVKYIISRDKDNTDSLSILTRGYCPVNSDFKVCDMYDMYNDTNTFPFLKDMYCNLNSRYSHEKQVVPIIIDCVDKTTVRNIINAFFKSWNRLPSLSQRYYSNIVSSLSKVDHTSRSLVLDDGFDKEIDDLTSDTSSNKYTLVLNDIDSIAITKVVDGKEEFSEISKSLSYSEAYCCSYDTNLSYANNNSIADITEMYLISSGNGEYTGQVAWGRVSQKELATRPVCYRDIFGDEERPGSKLSKDQAEDLGCKRILKGTFCLRDKISPFKDSNLLTVNVPILTVSNDFKLKADYSFSYKEIQKIFKNKFLWEKDFNTILVEPKTKNFFNAMNTKYIHDGFEDLFTKAHSSVLRGENKDLHSLNIKNNSYIDYLKETIPNLEINKNFAACATRRGNTFSTYINSLTGNPMNWEFKNFDDWMSQYLSVPIPYSVFPELVDIEEDIKEEQMSCAQRAVENVQSMQANKTAANLVVNFAVQILEGLTNGGTTMSIASVYFDTRDNLYSPTYITTDYLKSDKYEVDETLDDLKIVYELADPKELYVERKKGDIKEVYSTTASSENDTFTRVNTGQLNGIPASPVIMDETVPF